MISADMRDRVAPALAWLVALLFCAWLYWPGLSGPSLLDDGINLRGLELLTSGESSVDAVVRGNTSGPLGRPVSMLSFAVEKLYFDGGVRGTKRTNLLIHLLCGTLILLFTRDVLRVLDAPHAAWYAWLAAATWLLSPLLVSSVLYSVQRMAQLAAFFSLLGLWSYLRLRLASGVAWHWAALFLLSLVAAPLSKENGLLLIPEVMLLEYMVLGYRARSATATARLQWAHGAVLASGALLVLLAWLLYPSGFFAGYAHRDFTLYERVLTQARVLWIYTGQLFWAQPEQLGIYQDSLPVAAGLTAPMSTLWSVVAWIVLAVLVLAPPRHRLRGVRFGIGLYLVAHAMESSVFPLEMYFEHRNYLPAAGLVIALASLASELTDWRLWLRPWLLLIALLVVGRSALVTATETQIWSSQLLFHLTAINRFPDSVRANSEMGRTMALDGNLERALAYSSRVRQLDPRGSLRHQLRDAVLHCLARPAIETPVITRLSAAPEDFADDDVSEKLYLLVKEVIDGRCPETDMPYLAARLGELVSVADPQGVSPAVWLSLAILENRLENYESAMNYVDSLIAKAPAHAQAHLMRLYFLSRLGGDYANSESMRALVELERQGKLKPDQQETLALFIE